MITSHESFDWYIFFFFFLDVKSLALFGLPYLKNKKVQFLNAKESKKKIQKNNDVVEKRIKKMKNMKYSSWIAQRVSQNCGRLSRKLSTCSRSDVQVEVETKYITTIFSSCAQQKFNTSDVYFTSLSLLFSLFFLTKKR